MLEKKTKNPKQIWKIFIMVLDDVFGGVTPQQIDFSGKISNIFSSAPIFLISMK